MSKRIPNDPTLKVARRCPRCRLTGYYFTDAQGVRNRMSCSNCGHLWAGRVTHYERGGDAR